ncbi:MAG: beta-galactosidase [Armatimonadota bacterium]|nr:beta-galactosidase [Armatimonadota bacterium]
MLLFTHLVCHGDENFSLNGYQVSGTRATPTSEGLKVDFGTREAWPNIRWNAPGDTGWDWSPYNALVLTLKNPGEENVAFHVKISDRGKDGKKHATQVSGNVPAGETGRFYVSLESRALKEKSRMRYLPPIIGEYGTHLGGGVEPSHIEELQIFRATPTKPATLIIKSIVLAGQATNFDLNGIIDRYGQYTRDDWPGKVKSDADLLAQKKAEAEDWAAHPALSDRSKWGGWASGPRQKATGFFRTEQIDSKWWLVDPEGYLFLSVGIDVVHRNANATLIQGREAMFTWLPAADDPLSQYYGEGKKMYNFLRANLARKYGVDDTDQAFGDRAVRRLKSWGFNTLGNWTPESIGQERQFPYVVAVGTRGGFATVPGHRGGKMPDPFDPRFAVDVEANIRPKAALARNDPACIGYFFDNELPWGMPNVDAERYVLCFGTLSLGANSPAKQAFLTLLKQRYASIVTLNAVWGTNLASWEQLAAPFKVPMAIKSDAQRKDFSDFLGIYAGKYFEVVSSTLKRHDPNHLYLGCRFAFWFTREAVASSAKYVDVISFNIYSWNRNTYLFAQNLGKPCIVGEFHFGATDRGMFSGNITVKDQQARADSYMWYVKSVLSEPAFVGCHWFQYYDQPTTGRGQDGENFNIGFASITDTPYPELIAGARAANAQIYQWHAAVKGAPETEKN